MEQYENYFQDKSSENDVINKNVDILRTCYYDEIRSLNDQTKLPEFKANINWKTKDFKQIIIDSFKDTTEKIGIYCLQFDDKKIVIGLRNSQIQIFYLSTNKLDVLNGGHSGSVLSIAFNDNVIISGSSDSQIVIWNISNYQIIARLFEHHDRVNNLKLYKETLLSCSHDKNILVWNISQPEQVKLVKNLANDLLAYDSDLRCNAIDMNTSYLIAGIFNKIKVWNSKDLSIFCSLDGHDKIITCLQMSDDLIVSASEDETVRIWSLNKKHCLKLLKCHTGEFICCIGFNDDVLATCSFRYFL
jgi:F-box and WD-40 domain protein 1/11